MNHKPDKARIARDITKWLTMKDDNFGYMAIGIFIGTYEFKRLNHLTWGWTLGILNAYQYFKAYPSLSKTAIMEYFQISNAEIKKGLPEQIAPFFFIDPKGRYTPSPAGNALMQSYTSLLRRLLQDNREYYKLLYDRWDKEQKRTRQEYKRFFRLPFDEQMKIARQYYAMIVTNDQERAAKRSIIKYLKINYDITPADLGHFANAHPIARIKPLNLGARNDQGPTQDQDTTTDQDNSL